MDVAERAFISDQYEISLVCALYPWFLVAGYGGRQTTEECPEAILLMSVQETTLINLRPYLTSILTI
jgi:hypothetical protein